VITATSKLIMLILTIDCGKIRSANVVLHHCDDYLTLMEPY